MGSEFTSNLIHNSFILFHQIIAAFSHSHWKNSRLSSLLKYFYILSETQNWNQFQIAGHEYENSERRLVVFHVDNHRVVHRQPRRFFDRRENDNADRKRGRPCQSDRYFIWNFRKRQHYDIFQGEPLKFSLPLGRSKDWHPPRQRELCHLGLYITWDFPGFDDRNV